MSYLLWLLKYILLFVLAFIIYLVYTIVVKVYFVRRKYSKYPNVYLNPTFVPFLGDLLEFIKSVNGGGVYYSHLFEKAQIYSKFDLKVEMEGSVTVIKVISPEAQKCFKDLQPTKIDRYAEWKAFGKIGPQGFFNIRSNTAFNDRKKLFMSLLSFNSVSKYIPNIFECTKRSLKNLKTNDEFDCVPIMNLLTFNVFVQIMFGKDVEQIVILGADYINKEGITERINLCEFLVRLLKDLIDGYLHPFTLALPFINYYSLANPFKRNNKNINTLQKCLMEVINKCNDTDSICFKLINNENFDKTVILQDMIAFLVGGTESTAHTLTSILYFLKKNPEKYDVLMKELSQYGFKRFNESLESFEKENLHEVNYLNYTIREALRMDAPFFESLSLT